MRKRIYTLLLILVPLFSISLISCKSNETKTDEKTVNEEVAKPVDNSKGKEIYETKGMCQTCHQADGKGLAGNYPPLAGSEYLLADKQRAIVQTLKGSSEPITVNGVVYPGNIMGAVVANINLTDDEVVAVVNYILNSWGNNGGNVTIEDVKKARSIK